MISIARTFGAPDTVPAGKQATSASSRSCASSSLPFDDRHQVHDVRVALERHVGRHAHRAVRRHAADVVAPEVDEHDVLGALLLVALQLLGRAARPLPRCARAGACRRSDASATLPPFDAHQHLGRRADDRPAADAEEVHVRRRVDVPQRAIDRERVGVERRLEPLRQHDLVDVAGGDVLLRRADHPLELRRA